MKKRIHKCAALFLAAVLAFPIHVSAAEITAVQAQGSTTGVVVSGTCEDAVSAVIIQIRDANQQIVTMESYAAADGAYKGTLSISLPAGSYQAYVADYAGGDWKIADFTVVQQGGGTGGSGSSGGTDSEKPSGGTDSEKPDDGAGTEKPDDGTDSENPGDGTDTEKPDDGTDSENPGDGNDNTDTDKPADNDVAKGDTVTKGTVTYKVTDTAKNTVTYTKTETTSAKVVIPSTIKIDGTVYRVTAIADNAFTGNKKLKEVKSGSNITVVGKNAFSGCSKLKKVTLDSKVTTIKEGAFKNCTALTSIVVPASVKKIGANAFKGDSKLNTLVIQSPNLTKSGVKNALKGSSVKTIQLKGKAKEKYKKYIEYFAKANSGKKVTIVKK